MSDHLTEQLDALERLCKTLLKTPTDHPDYIIRRECMWAACGDGIRPHHDVASMFITLITALRAEREAHQSTRAALDAARTEIAQELADCERWQREFAGMNPEMSSRINKWKTVLECIDAARAGQESSDV